MLTVKNVLWDGTEDIVEAVRVSTGRVRPPETLTEKYEWKEQVYAQQDKDNVVTFQYGDVYVMNASGKTVGMYRLMAGPVSSDSSEIKA